MQFKATFPLRWLNALQDSLMFAILYGVLTSLKPLSMSLTPCWCNFIAINPYFNQPVSIQPGSLYPTKHLLTHYQHLIEEFGAPNGLCSSITESRHITAVKRPWYQSNYYEALGQMCYDPTL